MQTVVVFDCESDGRLPPGLDDRSASAAAVRAERFERIQCTCAVAIVLDAALLRDPRTVARALSTASKIVCWRDKPDTSAGANDSPFAPLLRAFDDATLIVGYNAYDFDFPLLRKHYRSGARYMAHRLKTHDPFDDIRARTGRWESLDNLLKTNGLQTKNGLTGLDAVRLWDEIQFSEVPEAGLRARKALEKYCENDVRCTAQLVTRPTLALRTVGALPGVVLNNAVFGVAAALARAGVGDAYASLAASATADGAGGAGGVDGADGTSATASSSSSSSSSPDDSCFLLVESGSGSTTGMTISVVESPLSAR